MTTECKTCPICGEAIEVGADKCAVCGFQMIGGTEAFKPVSVDANHVSSSPVSHPTLRVSAGLYTGQEFTLGEGAFTIGRDPSCDIFLNNRTVSRLHATIKIANGNARIIDGGSLNGTWLDGTVVDEAPLHNGCVIQIGTFEMVYESKQA